LVITQNSCFVLGRFGVQISTRRPATLTDDVLSFLTLHANSETVPKIAVWPLTAHTKTQ
jgi:hypothetical protein